MEQILSGRTGTDVQEPSNLSKPERLNASGRLVTAADDRAVAVNTFWRDAKLEKWFARDPEFDAEFRRRFEHLHFAAAARELDDWMKSAEGALALMILLDQFPRNSYRGTGHMFATDVLALRFAKIAVHHGLRQSS